MRTIEDAIHHHIASRIPKNGKARRSKRWPKIFGLLGDPVEHSLSPIMHQIAYDTLGMDAIYIPFHVKDKDLEDAIGSIKRLNIVGVNVTIPHKVAASRIVPNLDPHARRIGAINTIKNSGDRITGFNTDGIGFVEAITTSHSIDFRKLSVVVVGCGGVGQSICHTLLQSGVPELIIYNRSPREDVFRSLRTYYPARLIDWRSDPDGLDWQKTDLLVNATPLGMRGYPPFSLPIEKLRRDAIVVDTVYRKGGTKLLAQCRRIGLRGVDGLDMLYYQGRESFRIWTGITWPSSVKEQFDCSMSSDTSSPA